jgi:hypothetical protein
MRRKLFNLAAACSLALCLSTLALWLRSYASAEAIGYAGSYRAGEVSFVNGRLHIWRWATSDPSWAANAWWPGWRYVATAPTNSWAYRLPGGTVTSSFAFAGTNYLRHSLPRATAADTIWYFHTPGWAVLLVTAAPAAWWGYRRRRERAARARQLGLCRAAMTSAPPPAAARSAEPSHNPPMQVATTTTTTAIAFGVTVLIAHVLMLVIKRGVGGLQKSEP